MYRRAYRGRVTCARISEQGPSTCAENTKELLYKIKSNYTSKVSLVAERLKASGTMTELVTYAPPAGGKLAQWGLTMQSSLEEYWEQAAIHTHNRSAEQQEACRKMPDLFDSRDGATSIEMMVALYRNQAEDTIAEGGGPPGWVKAVEFNTGIKFQTLLGAPDSAALVVTKGGERTLSKRDTTSKFDKPNEPSLAWLLQQRYPTTDGVPTLPVSIKLAPKDTENTTTECAVPVDLATRTPAHARTRPHKHSDLRSTSIAIPLPSHCNPTRTTVKSGTTIASASSRRRASGFSATSKRSTTAWRGRNSSAKHSLTSSRSGRRRATARSFRFGRKCTTRRTTGATMQ